MEELTRLAKALAGGSASADAREMFCQLLAKNTDLEYLRALAEQCTPDLDVSVPIYKRILDLNPLDTQAAVALGFAYWLGGEDEVAWKYLSRAKQIDSEDVNAATLEAALVQDPQRKLAIYQWILKKDPDNKIALENLRQYKESGHW